PAGLTSDRTDATLDPSSVAGLRSVDTQPSPLAAFEWRWLWRRAQGESLRIAGDSSESIYCLAFSPDGRTLASGAGGGVINFWEADTLRALRTMVQSGNVMPPRDPVLLSDGRIGAPVFSVSFSRD